MTDTIFNERKLGFLDIYKFDRIIAIKDQEIRIIKDRYDNPDRFLSFEEIQNLAFDILCRGIKIYHYDIFTTSFTDQMKQKLKEVIDQNKVDL